MKLLILVSSTLFAGTLLANIAPIFIGGLIEQFNVSESNAGLVLSSELIASALTALLLSAKLVKYPPKYPAIIGIIILFLSQVMSLFATSYDVLLVTRVFSGFGAGLILISHSFIISRCANPDRTFAHAFILMSVFFTTFMWSTGAIVHNIGLTGLYLAIIAVCLLFLPIFLSLFDISHSRLHKNESSNQQLDKPKAIPITRWTIVLLLLASVAILSFIEMGLWTFAERIADMMLIPTNKVSIILGLSNLMVLVGAAVASIGMRFSRTLSVIFGIMFTGLACAFTATADSELSYTIAILCYGFGFGFVSPYIIGTAAKIDREGRVVAWTNGVMQSLGALAPYLAGVLIISFTYKSLGWILMILTFLSMAIIYPVTKIVKD